MKRDAIKSNLLSAHLPTSIYRLTTLGFKFTPSIAVVTHTLGLGPLRRVNGLDLVKLRFHATLRNAVTQ